MEQALIFTDENEFLTMWHGLCWERCGSVYCTEPKDHKGSHCCDFAKLDRYNELRRVLQK